MIGELKDPNFGFLKMLWEWSQKTVTKVPEDHFNKSLFLYFEFRFKLQFFSSAWFFGNQIFYYYSFTFCKLLAFSCVVSLALFKTSEALVFSLAPNLQSLLTSFLSLWFHSLSHLTPTNPNWLVKSPPTSHPTPCSRWGTSNEENESGKKQLRE